jgi:hypothetical protein
MSPVQTVNSTPLTIQFRHMPKSTAIEQAAIRQINRIGSIVAEGSHCEVVIHRSHPMHKGGTYDVSVRLSIPRHRLYVAHRSETGGSADVAHMALLDAFEEIKRQIIKTRTRYRRNRYLKAA